MLLFTIYLSFTHAQLTLPESYQLARQHYPLLQKSELLQRATDIRLQNLEKENLPTIRWNAKGSFQSETVSLPFSIAGQELVDLPLYNIQTTLEANYILYDGGINEAQQQLEKLRLQAEKQLVEVDLYNLYEQVNNNYFGVLLLRAQKELLQSTQEDLERRLQLLQAGLKHGVVLESDVKQVQVQVLKLQSSIAETERNTQALLAILSAIIGQELPADVQLAIPQQNDLVPTTIQRPELQLFEFQKQTLIGQEALIMASTKPKVSTFAQAGIGYPNPLNFLEAKVSPFGIVGVQFTWNFWDWGKANRDRELLGVQRLLIDNQQETFEFNINRLEGKYREDIRRVEELIENDQAVAALQEEILQQIAAQLEHGVVTTTDYLTHVNAKLQAELSLQTHRLQLEQIKVNYLTHKGLLILN